MSPCEPEFPPLLGAVITSLTLLRNVRHRSDSRPVDTLAEAVRGQWRKAATERGLATPAPIPVRWSLSDLPVAGPVEAAGGDPDVATLQPVEASRLTTRLCI